MMAHKLIADSGGDSKSSNWGSWRLAGLGGGGCAALSLPFLSKEKEYVRSEPFPKRSEQDERLLWLETPWIVWPKDQIPDIAPTRMISTPEGDATGLRLRLYQYQSCPFCSKVRAFLDYYGFSYELVEVNSVTRRQTRWNKQSKKVPMLILLNAGSEEAIQVPDSSFQMTVLRSLMLDLGTGMEGVLSQYPMLRESVPDGDAKDWRGRQKTREVTRCDNKYFLMFKDSVRGYAPIKSIKEEREWRLWVDRKFVHLISPNVYRTFAEARETFRWFSEFGDWEANWGTAERLAAVYLGALAMWLIAKRLKNKYGLKEDVRESLYEGAREWTKALGKVPGRRFMGGDKPNLADLSMYGMLTSFEGTGAFADMRAATTIGPWFDAMKDAVTRKLGRPELAALIKAR